MAGLEAVVLSAGLVLALAFATVAATPAADGSVSADWVGAWDVATATWLLAHGVPAHAGDVTVTLIPLGLVLVTMLIVASVAGRLAIAAHASVLCAGLAYGAAVFSTAIAEGVQSGPSIRAGIIGALICGTGASLGLKRTRGFRFWGTLRFPPVVAAGLRIGVGAWALCLAVGAATAVAWEVAHVGDIASSVDRLNPDVAGGFALAIGEVAYVPTISVWALSWLAGPGFAVGSGSNYSTGNIVGGPTPDLPLLGALPSESGGLLRALPLVLVVVGVVVRIAARKWVARGLKGFSAQVWSVAVLGALTWGVVGAARGAVGVGVLREVGPQPLVVAFSVAGLVAVGMFLTSSFIAVVRRSRPTTVPPGGGSGTSPTRVTVPSMPSQSQQNTDPLRLW